MITVGLDLAKTVFQVHVADGLERAVLRKKLHRAHVLEFFCHLGDGFAYATAQRRARTTLVARNVTAATQTMEGPAGVSRT